MVHRPLPTNFILSALVLYLINTVPCQSLVSTPTIMFQSGNDSEDEGNDIFEGDLRVPPEFIYQHYDLKSLLGGEHAFSRKYADKTGRSMAYFRHEAARSAVGAHLWDNNTIWYKISTSFSGYATRLIHQALEYWENRTCLRFLPAGESPDYVHFIRAEAGCYATYIGKQGGMQIVNIGYNCVRFRYIVHEIGHVVGFWHEHTRPDRDDFVTVYTNRVYKRNIINFVKRKSSNVDYQGVKYDYGSIMHYPENAFARLRCFGAQCITIAVKNFQEYYIQGRPDLGAARELSPGDIQQANRLYSCPGSGLRGFLVIEFQESLMRCLATSHDVYVLFKALDSKGNETALLSSYKQGNQPVWNEFLLFGENEWQFFRAGTWSQQLGTSKQILMPLTVSLDQRYGETKHCKNSSCLDFIAIKYIVDGNASVNASLRFYFRSAFHLVDSEPVWYQPDPYIRITAVSADAVTHIRTTQTVSDTTNPTWNEWIDCGCRNWKAAIIQVLDEDIGIDDKMSAGQLIFLQPGNHSYLVHKGYGQGYLNYDYSLIHC